METNREPTFNISIKFTLSQTVEYNPLKKYTFWTGWSPLKEKKLLARERLALWAE